MKKIISSIMICLLLLGFSACGENSAGNDMKNETEKMGEDIRDSADRVGDDMKDMTDDMIEDGKVEDNK